MAGNIRSQYTNLVKMKLDQQSLKTVKKQVKDFKNQCNKMLNFKVKMTGIDKNLIKPKSQNQTPYKEPKQQTIKAKDTFLAQQLKAEDKYIKQRDSLRGKEDSARIRQTMSNMTGGGSAGSARDSALADLLRKEEAQAKFNTLQQDSINNFLVSNKLAREMTESQREAVVARLKQTKSAKELRLEIRKIRGELSDNLGKRKALKREADKQLAVQQRFNASITQMVGSLGSVYVLTSAISASIKTGMKMESVEKSFKVVSTDSKAAGENMKWIRDLAMEMGTPIMEASRGFSSMIASAGNKVGLEDIKTTFKGIQEAGVALGLSSDDLNGTIYAVKQMFSKNRIQAEELSY